jgi:hypothetical protein
VKIELAIVSASKATIAKDRMKTTTRFSLPRQKMGRAVRLPNPIYLFSSRYGD